MQPLFHEMLAHEKLREARAVAEQNRRLKVARVQYKPLRFNTKTTLQRQ